jgi:hypothetical protein
MNQTKSKVIFMLYLVETYEKNLGIGMYIVHSWQEFLARP